MGRRQKKSARNPPDLEMRAAVQCFQEGKLAKADTICKCILRHNPSFTAALALRGIIAIEAGDSNTAVKYFREAIAIEPENGDLHHKYSKVLYKTGKIEEATRYCRKATTLNPHNAFAWLDLGGTLAIQGKTEEALQAYRMAVKIKPDLSHAEYNIGLLLGEQRNYQMAIGHYRRAVELQPDHAGAWNNLSSALRITGQYEEAIGCCKKALQLNPVFENAHMNIGLTLQEQGRLEHVLPHYERALELAPDYAGAHFNRAVWYLLQGNFARGWEEFEWRWQLDDLKRYQRRFTQPEWDGTPGDGRTILVYTEQGLGDTFQFIRYVPLLAQKGFSVIIQCDLRVREILAGITGAAQIIAFDESPPPFDVYAALMSLPRLFGTELASIPAQVPYLHADTEHVEHWKSRIGETDGLKVGICWRGNPDHRNDINRSIDVGYFAGVARLPGIRLFSIQKPLSEQDASNLPGSGAIVELGSQLDSGPDKFLDTAAVMQHLDLVITVDTSVAHIAGALARPVWLLLPYVPDWRWMLKCEDSPWYPTMRLFRQQTFGDWSSVFVQVEVALAEFREKY